VRTKYINAATVIPKLFGFDELTCFILYMHNYIILVRETLNSPFYTCCYITPKIERIIVAHVEVCIPSLHSCYFILNKTVVMFLIFRIGIDNKNPCPLRYTLWLIAQPSAEKKCNVGFMVSSTE